MNGGYLLDTNIPSETLRPSPDVKVAAWLGNHPKNSQFVSVVTLGELRRGITLLAPGARRTQLERFY
jgi:predicted nucleic acid-binding protein